MITTTTTAAMRIKFELPPVDEVVRVVTFVDVTAVLVLPADDVELTIEEEDDDWFDPVVDAEVDVVPVPLTGWRAARAVSLSQLPA
jgi:hypothetical protein